MFIHKLMSPVGRALYLALAYPDNWYYEDKYRIAAVTRFPDLGNISLWVANGFAFLKLESNYVKLSFIDKVFLWPRVKRVIKASRRKQIDPVQDAYVKALTSTWLGG